MDGKIVIVKKKKYNTVISSSSEDENDSDYVASKRSNNISSGSDSSDLSSNEYYEIEKLLDKRINPITGVTEYLVKWEGYSSDENTWEPEPNLVEDDNEDLITEWRQSQAMKSPELRAAKNTLLSKLRARHLTPTLGRVLSGDDFVLPQHILRDLIHVASMFTSAVDVMNYDDYVYDTVMDHRQNVLMNEIENQQIEDKETGEVINFNEFTKTKGNA